MKSLRFTSNFYKFVFFFLVSSILLSVPNSESNINPVYAEEIGTVTKLIDGEKVYLGNGQYKASLNLAPIRIIDSNGNIVDSESIQNSTHISVNSVHGKFLVNKNSCVLNMLNDDDSVRTVETYELYNQKSTENPITGTWVKDPTNNFNCELQSIITNSTGVYIPFKRVETESGVPTGNELNITFKKEEGKEPKWDASYKVGERAGQKYDKKFMWLWKTKLTDLNDKIEIIDSIFETSDGLSIDEKDDGGSLKASTTKFDVTKTEIDTMVSSDITLDKKIKYIKNNKSVYQHDFTPASDLFQDVSVQIEDGLLVSFARYVDLTVPQKGDIITIDPTFSTDNPTTDLSLTDEDNDSVCEESPTTVAKQSDASTILQIGRSSTAEGNDCARVILEFPISSVPDDVIITAVDLSLYFSTFYTQPPTTGCDIVSLNTNQPSVATGATLWGDFATATEYVNQNLDCKSELVNPTISLGSSAVTDLTNQLSSDWFGIGMRSDGDVGAITGTYYWSQLVAEDHATLPAPTLEVTYSNPTPSVPLNPVIYTNSTSEVYFDWDAPVSCDNCGGYTVWNASNGAIIDNSTDSSVTFLQLEGLTSGKNQTLMVSAWNGTGSGTNSSTVFNFTINTPPILDKVNIINTTAMQLFYTINGTFNGIQVNIDEFPYSTFTTLIANSTSSAVTLIVNGFTESIDTAVKIFAHNLGGTSEESNQVINATNTPEVPVLTSSGQTSSTITLVMASNNTGSTYNISKSPTGCASLVSLINSTDSPYVVSDLLINTEYCFQAESVNAYGNSTGSILLNVTTSSTIPITGGGGASSGGGSSSSSQSSITNALLLNLNSKTLQLSLGEKRTYSLELIWDETKEFSLFVKNIKLGQGQFDSLSIVPESLPELGKKIIAGNGEVLFTIDVPSDQCGSTQNTARCVSLKTYTIPVMVSVEDILGTSYPDIAGTLTITIIEKFPIGLAIILILLMSFTYPIYRIISMQSRKPNNPKNKKKNHDKILEKARQTDDKKAKHNKNILKRIKKGF